MNTAAILAILNNNYSIKFNKIELYRDGGSLSYIVFGNGKKYFLKIIRPVFIETAVQSIDLQLYLSKNNVPVPNIFFSKYMNPTLKHLKPAESIYTYYMSILKAKNLI